jgi:hypothetical protein
LKIADLEKNKGRKIASKLNRTIAPGRFGKEAAAVLDRREQRKRDQALGLVPFAVKLNSDLVEQIRALAQARQRGLNDLVADLLKKGLEN